MKITLLALFILLCRRRLRTDRSRAFEPAADSLSCPTILCTPCSMIWRPRVPLVGGGAYTYAQGERPLWEFGPAFPPPTPLGDVARAFRKEKLAAKKAEIVLEKQGS